MKLQYKGASQCGWMDTFTRPSFASSSPICDVGRIVTVCCTASVEAYFVGRLGAEALAGLSLVFPLLMLMQQMANGSMGGAIASAVARAIGSGRREDASALIYHALLIGYGMAALFCSVLLLGGPTIYGLMGGRGASLAAAVE